MYSITNNGIVIGMMVCRHLLYLLHIPAGLDFLVVPFFLVHPKNEIYIKTVVRNISCFRLLRGSKSV